MTLAEIETIYIAQLPPMYEKEEAKSLAALAIGDVCKISRSYLMLHKAKEITLKEETALIRILDELRMGRPLQYVLGEADFYGLRFSVNKDVLIPRPETEELVYWIISSIKEDGRNLTEDLRIVDIGTGSGCIPVALKKNLPEAEVCALDISFSAIETAIQNAVNNDTEVHFFQADILDPHLSLLPLTFEVIVSNPPYIRESEKAEMHKNVLDNEPYSALFVSDNDPLIFYKSIGNFARKHLSTGGALFLEINGELGAETADLLNGMGFETELRKDAQGKNRMIKAQLNLPA